MASYLKKRMTITIEADVPEGVTNSELRRYVQEALATYGGSGDWIAPLFAGVAARKVVIDKEYRLVHTRRWHA